MKVLSFTPVNIEIALTRSHRSPGLSGSPLVLVHIHVRRLLRDGSWYLIRRQIWDALVGPHRRTHHHNGFPASHWYPHGHRRIQSQYREPCSSMWFIALRMFLILTLAPWQMVGGAMVPGKPVANMYFTLYGYQTYTLTLNLLRDLKLVCPIHVLVYCSFC